MLRSPLSRRQLLRQGAVAASAAALRPSLLAQTAPASASAGGPFEATWESLRAYHTPDWFRDAKFGIWAHWSAQCVPEQGDWYARRMYLQGDPCYEHHLKTYGHPSAAGFMEIDNLWKAERWKPEELMSLYKAAGARYFVSLASHHDNFDNFDSTHHAWNSTRIGPRRDIIGTWARIARSNGLRFGVSNHSSHAWHWFQTAYGYDAVGPKAGARYDAYTLTKADGKGKWWEGLDPQQLYTGRNLVIPSGITSPAEMRSWHEEHDGKWHEEPPPDNPEFTRTWALRCTELLEKYQPDLIYFDDDELPLGQAGLDVTAHFYNASVARHGSLQCVVNAKHLKPGHEGAVTLDIERGRAQAILAQPWQTDTCIGDWHYKRSIFEEHRYKTPTTVIHMLIDIVSKNGNLLLSIPVRGDGTIDEDEHAFLAELAAWMNIHGEAIFGTRPFSVFGEGPPEQIDNSNFNEKMRDYTAEDLRFTTRGSTLYAFIMAKPANGRVLIRTLGRRSSPILRKVKRVELLGAGGPLHFTEEQDGVAVTLPSAPFNPHAACLRIQF